jgi:uncharacterized protein (DUF58 family)
MPPTVAQTFQYRFARAVRSPYPGAHVGQMVGAGQLFKQHAPLMAGPDPRRIDIRASALDPFGSYLVRVYQQKSQLTVCLVADLSASMRYRGTGSKQEMLADCLLSAAESADRTGDRFGFIGCGETVERDMMIVPTRNYRGRIGPIAQLLRNRTLQGHAKGLLRAGRFLPEQPALVFVASDFHLPLQWIQKLMEQFNRHAVVPLVLWDKREYETLPAWGSVRFADLEQGRTRTLFLRPALRRRIIDAFLQRRKELQRCFRAFGSEPLFFDHGFRAEAVTRYFLRHPA